MTITIFDNIFGRILRDRPGLERIMYDISAELEARRVCQKTRKELLELSDDQLKDIGITKAQALEEARRGFWD